MASFATDLHATPQELAELVGKWMSAYPIFGTAEEMVDDAPLPGPPSRTLALTLENYRELFANPKIWEVLFTVEPVTTFPRSIFQILGKHPGGLCLQVYHIGPRGLPQARLSTMDATPLWKQLNRELKKLTTAGADIMWESGRTAFDRNARFSPEAKALAASGVPLRQSAQCTYIYKPK